MRAYIIADMVGSCGIWRKRQCQVGTSEWRQARRQLTMDVNAAIEGLQRLGYPEIYIKDIHAHGTNLRRKILLPGVMYEPGIHLAPIPLLGRMRWANCAVLLGFHAPAGAEAGFYPHTLREDIEELTVNGNPVGETQMIAALLGDLDIAVTFVSGDGATLEPIKKQIPWVQTLEIPKDRQSNLGTADGGTTMIRKRNEIRAKIERCCIPKANFKKFRFERPVEFALTFRSEEGARLYI